MKTSTIQLTAIKKTPSLMAEHEITEIFDFNPFELQLLQKACNANVKSIKTFMRQAVIAYALYFNSDRNAHSKEMIRYMETVR